jgi:hypothetical protein
MRSKALLLLIPLLVLLLVPWADALAAPVPPVIVVNDDTQQCATMFAGDECTDCFPPEGWVSLGPEGQCPAGYTMIDNVDYTCQHFKAQFCCSEGHSGAPGDCTDLVVDDKGKQCAFVADIQGCGLPKGWATKPARVEARDWVCPAEYEWIDELACVEGASTPPTSGGNALPCLGAIVIGPSVLVLWLLVRKGH